MFKRNHHVRIATILQALDAEALSVRGCFFGGGTAIALSYNEFRESIDIDFLISNLKGYRDLRQAIKEKNDLSAITRKDFNIPLSRDVRVDQYGIRTMIDQEGVEIKFEIVNEGRIKFEPPTPDNKICGITTLTPLDMAASKLLANSDRWSDDAVFSRDIIDLAMMELSKKEFNEAKKKARTAYGDSVDSDLKKALQNFKDRPGKLKECLSMLKMEGLPEALLWEKMRKLI